MKWNFCCRLLEYWQRLETEKKEKELEENQKEGEDGEEEFSLDFGNDSNVDVDVENNTGIKINIEDATPQKEAEQPNFEAGVKIKSKEEQSQSTEPEQSEALHEAHKDTLQCGEVGDSLPFIDDQPYEANQDENKSAVPSFSKDVNEEKDKAQDNSNPGYKSGMKKFFQNVSEAQQGEEGDFSVESRYSDEDSEIKNILGSGKRNSKYVVKSDEESLNKSKGYKIPVLDTSGSEFEESELSRAGFSIFAFDDKE